MSERNTPNIGGTLNNTRLKFIPEAHCYLKINGERVDFTSSKSDIEHIKNDILLERSIQPEDVTTHKVVLHKKFINNWITKEQGALTFEYVWALREACIGALQKAAQR